MTTTTLEHSAQTAWPRSRRRGGLALALQEAFTVAVRLRAGRQVAADAASFRIRIKQLLAAADREARQAGYDGDHVRLAIYAFIAFLDESVLNSDQPMYADWPRQPLQEEIFGDHMAGETFFRNLESVLSRQDSEDNADLLEVYLLCILLGFRGRYGAGDAGAIHPLVAAVQDKIRRGRGEPDDLSPSWAPPENEVIRTVDDPWIRRLGMAAAALAGVAAVLYVVFKLALHPGIGELRTLASQLIR